MGSGGLKTGIGFVDNPVNYVTGGQMNTDIQSAVGNGGPSALDQIGAQVTAKEQQARSDAYGEALTNTNIDEVTRSELINLYNNGTSSTQLQSILTAAKEGKGLYAVRKIVENNAAVMRSMPGRTQLVSLGAGIVRQGA